MRGQERKNKIYRRRGGDKINKRLRKRKDRGQK